MAITVIEDSQQLRELLKLPRDERLRLARWLIDSAVAPLPSAEAPPANQAANGLLALAGRYAGGAGDTAERAEEILEAEVNPTDGLSAP
jgi:hypothetical protein